jgi:predicted ATPase
MFRYTISFDDFLKNVCSMLQISLSVSDLWQVAVFLRVLTVSSTNKTDCHDITEILLKVVFNPDPNL